MRSPLLRSARHVRTLVLLTAGLFAGSRALAQTPVNLTVLTWYNADQEKLFNQAIAEYQKATPGVTIKQTTVAGTGAATFPNVLRTSIAGGRAPDIFTMWAGSLAAPFIDAGFASDMSTYYTKYNWNKLLLPSAVKTITHGGKVYGVPIDLRGIALYYRKDVLSKAGVTPPTTFAQWEAACAKLKTQDIPCVTAAGTYGWHIMRLFDVFLEHTAGANLHDQLLANKTSWDRPEVVAAFALLKKWTDNGWLPNGYMGINPTQAEQLFQQGKAAMILEGDWYVPILATANVTPQQYGFVTPPTGSKRLEGFAEQLIISQQSKNKDAAAAFLNWWAQPATQAKYYAVNGSSGTAKATPDAAKNPAGAAYAKLVGAASTYPILDQTFPAEFMSTTYFRLQSSVAAGQVTPADAAKQMQAGLATVK